MGVSLAASCTHYFPSPAKGLRFKPREARGERDQEATHSLPGAHATKCSTCASRGRCRPSSGLQSHSRPRRLPTLCSQRARDPATLPQKMGFLILAPTSAPSTPRQRRASLSAPLGPLCSMTGVHACVVCSKKQRRSPLRRGWGKLGTGKPALKGILGKKISFP